MTARARSRSEHLQKAQLAVIDALYATVTDPERWAEVVRAATNLIGGGISSVLYRSGSHLLEQRLLATELDPLAARSYEDYYGAINPWVVYQRKDRPLLETRESMLCSREQIEHSEFYADWLSRLDLRYSYNACVPLESGDTIELSSVRPARLGPFDQDEHDVLERLLPHLRRAVKLSARLGLAEAGLTVSGLLSRQAGTGIILVDADQRVLFMDLLAEQLLRQGGRLTARPSFDAVLNRAVKAATGAGRTVAGRTGAVLRIPQADEAMLSVAVSPLDERDRPPWNTGPLALVPVSAPRQTKRPDEARLRSLFDLTPAEARLVAALYEGRTLASYADRTGTSLNTVKTHLKHVFGKTGETRQLDLVRRVATDLALRFEAGAFK
jgi:DNA-binding CsgD family transcriptional regulator